MRCMFHCLAKVKLDCNKIFNMRLAGDTARIELSLHDQNIIDTRQARSKKSRIRSHQKPHIIVRQKRHYDVNHLKFIRLI